MDDAWEMAEGHGQTRFQKLGMPPSHLFIESRDMYWECMLGMRSRAMVKRGLIDSVCLLCVFSLSRGACLGTDKRNLICSEGITYAIWKR